MTTRKAKNPLMIFSMQVDSNRCIIPGLNRGRLSLWDDAGYFGKWLCTSSYEKLQSVNDFEKVGGITPDNASMPGWDWFQVRTALILQPGAAVDEGFIINYQGSNDWTTMRGSKRSQIMLHPDKNFKTSPGSYGCLALPPGEEWEDFKETFLASCGHLEQVRLGIIYTF